jgi:N6-adenosine-specific RNA methylase IME4
VTRRTLPINEIRVGKRHRKDLGNIDSLAASVREVGLLHPVAVTPDGELIAGERRMRACKQLGWKEIPVNVVPLKQIVLGEFHENANRKDFLPSEIDAIRRRLEPLEKAAAKKRQLAGRRPSGNFPEGGQVRDKIGAFAGVSGRQVEKIAEVMEAAEQQPKQFGHLLEIIDCPHGVSKAYYALRRAQDEHRVLNLAPVAGKFKTLVIDPPWAFGEDATRRGAVKYATMQREEILALPVSSWAENNCHLYLWTTNVQVPFACECMAAWGFEYRTMLTWAKPKYGLGRVFRGQTEHVLFGTKGKLATRCTTISTLFQAPLVAHSEKPEKFYEIVRAASFPPYGEAFQRKARPDFVNLYEQIAEAAQ